MLALMIAIALIAPKGGLPCVFSFNVYGSVGSSAWPLVR
jgi:hypothetical protein